MNSAKTIFTWPNDWEKFGEEMESEWQIRTLQSRRVLVGKSGAQVYLVDVAMPDYEGLAILKLALESYEPEMGEFDRHNVAENLDPVFAEKHLPKTIKNFRRDKRAAYLMTVAGEGLNYTTTFFELPASRQYLAAQKVSSALLIDWNRACAFASSGLKSTDVIVAWLKYRIGPKSRLPDLVQGSFGLSPDVFSFRLYGRDFPNPYLFAKGCFPDADGIILTPAIGRVHGDLHGDNLLVGEMEGTKNDFYIIDLASFEDGLPLFFDHTYLEFSLLLRERKGISFERYIEIVEALVDIETNMNLEEKLIDQSDHGLVWTIGLLRTVIRSWITTNHLHRKQDLDNQLLLARIAAGLNYANKAFLDDEDKASEKLKIFAFLYAAANLKKLLAFNKIDCPTDGPIAKLESENPLPSSSSWRQVWECCDGFDSRRNAYILGGGLN